MTVFSPAWGHRNNPKCQRALKRGQLGGAFKRCQFVKEVIGDFHGKYLVTFLEDASVANRLAMDKTEGIMQLSAAGMSERQIARTLDTDRKSVDRELHAQGAKSARPTKASTANEISI